MSKITPEMNMHNCQLCRKEWLGRCVGKYRGKDVSLDNEPCDSYEFAGTAQRLKEIEQHEKEQTLSDIHFQMENPLSDKEIKSLQNAFGEIYERGKSDGYKKAENDYHTQTEKDRQSSYDCGYEQGKADGYKKAISECDVSFFKAMIKSFEAEIRADERKKTINEEPRIKAFSKIYDICDDMIHETEWYDILARQKFDEIKRIVFDCVEQIKEQK